MTLQFFDLPPELREQVYVELLSSSSGYVALDSSSFEKRGRLSFFEYEPKTRRLQGKPFSLAILQTCRAVYLEASFIFWTQNTLALWQRELFCYGLERVAHRRVFNRVERVYLNLDLGRVEELYWTKISLFELGAWAQEGMLKSVTLNVAGDWRQLARLFQLRMFGESGILFGLPNGTAGELLFQEYMEALRGAAKGSLEHVRRRILLTSNLDLNECLARLVATPEDFRAFMEDLNLAWGGELLLDGTSFEKFV